MMRTAFKRIAPALAAGAAAIAIGLAPTATAEPLASQPGPVAAASVAAPNIVPTGYHGWRGGWGGHRGWRGYDWGHHRPWWSWGW